MAYRLKAKESVPEGVKRAACEELESAAQQLQEARGENRDEAIHEVRKSLKKTRALVRLTRFELGPLYGIANGRLRDLGQTLSEYRDARAMIETFDQIREKYRGDLGRRTLSSVRRGLASRKSQSERAAGLDAVLEDIAKSLQSEAQRVETWPLKTDGFAAIAPGLKQTYSRGRKALRAAHRDPTPANLHEWRKRVKDLWYHVRLLESLWTDVMQAYEKSLKELETWLGDDHNLVLLSEKVVAEPAVYGTAGDRELLLNLISKYREELRGNSFSLGERVYEEKPKLFLSRMEHLWTAWQNQPSTFKDVQKKERAPIPGKASNTAA